MEYRLATLEEIPTLRELRKIQLIEEGHKPVVNMDAELDEFFRRRMGDGSMLEWVGVENGEIVATGGLIFYDMPPAFNNKTGLKGYVCNMYTAPAYRRQGVASHILTTIIDEAKARGIRQMWIGASAMGKPVYAKQGFKDTGTWMDLNLF